MSGNDKIASSETLEKRGRAIGKVFGVWLFLLFTSIPILNMIFGCFILIWFVVNILSRSANLFTDFFWLIIGSIICMFGFLVPWLASEYWHMSYGGGWFLEVLINLFVCFFIVGGRLGHLFVNPKDSPA